MKIGKQLLKTGSKTQDCCQNCKHFEHLSVTTGVCQLIQKEITKSYNIQPTNNENGDLCVRPVVYIGNICDKFEKKEIKKKVKK